MMLVPRNQFDLFNEFFNDPFFAPVYREARPMPKCPENKPHHEHRGMKTDITESTDGYSFSIELPGFDKEDIKISVADGFMKVVAETVKDTEEKSEDNFIRKERFSGKYVRKYFVGKAVTARDIKASFKNGILNVYVPKIAPQIPAENLVEIGE